MAQVRRVAMAWLLEKDWPHWLEIDKGFQPDYQHWLARMESTYARLKAEGVNVLKVDVPVAEFEQWAASAGLDVGRDARAAFATYKMQQMDLH